MAFETGSDGKRLAYIFLLFMYSQEDKDMFDKRAITDFGFCSETCSDNIKLFFSLMR